MDNETRPVLYADIIPGFESSIPRADGTGKGTTRLAQLPKDDWPGASVMVAGVVMMTHKDEVFGEELWMIPTEK